MSRAPSGWRSVQSANPAEKSSATMLIRTVVFGPCFLRFLWGIKWGIESSSTLQPL